MTLATHRSVPNKTLSWVVMRAFHVEMAGVEPASEEKTTKITTYIVYLSPLAPSQPIDRILTAQPQSCPP
jgi:hypothetical protein